MHHCFKCVNSISVIDLSKFGIVSKTILQVIEQYRKETRDGQRKFLLDFDVHSLERFGNWPSDAIHSYFRLGSLLSPLMMIMLR